MVMNTIGSFGLSQDFIVNLHNSLQLQFYLGYTQLASLQ